MIVKDEANSIQQTIHSVLGIVDRYCILDTGSSDNTIELIKSSFGSTPGIIYSEPFIDFATTRNRVLELAGKECAFTLMLSGDEYLRNGEKYPLFHLYNKISFIHTLLYYLKHIKTKPGGIELKVHYGQTSYNSIRVCNTLYNWTYFGVTHEYVTSLTPKTTTYIMPYTNEKDVYILHDLSNL